MPGEWGPRAPISSTSAASWHGRARSPVTEAEERSRIEAVVALLAGTLEVPLSIDTYKANVAARAVELAPCW